MRRFYPESIRVFKNEPTSNNFEIRKLDNNVGQGVVALRAFKAGELIFAFRGFLKKEISLFTLQKRPGLHLHDPYFMGKILHSCEPNASCNMRKQFFIALRDIKEGEFVTMDYDETEDVLYRSFDCSCGSINCRKVIRGRKVPLILAS